MGVVSRLDAAPAAPKPPWSVSCPETKRVVLPARSSPPLSGARGSPGWGRGLRPGNGGPGGAVPGRGVLATESFHPRNEAPGKGPSSRFRALGQPSSWLCPSRELFGLAACFSFSPPPPPPGPHGAQGGPKPYQSRSGGRCWADSAAGGGSRRFGNAPHPEPGDGLRFLARPNLASAAPPPPEHTRRGVFEPGIRLSRDRFLRLGEFCIPGADKPASPRGAAVRAAPAPGGSHVRLARDARRGGWGEKCHPTAAEDALRGGFGCRLSSSSGSVASWLCRRGQTKPPPPHPPPTRGAQGGASASPGAGG